MVCLTPLLLLALQTPDTAVLRVRPVVEGEAAARARVRVGAVEQVVGRDGLATFHTPAGQHRIVVLRLGSPPDTSVVVLRSGQDTTVVIELEGAEERLEDIIVSATRSERRVDDTPLRVEIIDEEEIAEKAAMTPGDIAMMLNETSGLRVAATSPSLGAANVRIQGLRGRYTLMLADGLPLYGAQGSGFGLLQIPPLDLARVEVIKGTASALYGSAALGGVINLVSRRPIEEPVHEVLVNQTSRGGTDAVLFTAGPLGPVGTSLLASAHRQSRQDIDRDGWADMSGYRRIAVRPRVFADGENRSLFVTAGFTGEQREGGTLDGRVAPDGQPYHEGLATNRADAGMTARFSRGAEIYNLRASGMEQRHEHAFGPVTERDAHRTLFAEGSLAIPRGIWTVVAGAAYQHERYRNREVTGFDFDYRVPSAFAQIDVETAPALVLSGSARLDRHSAFGTILSPRVSALFRGPAQWTARLSTGTGVFAPVPFTDETDAIGLAPVTPGPLDFERAVNASLDVGGPVESSLGAIELNASVYASRLTDPVAFEEVVPPSTPAVRLINAPLPTRTWGAEALARVVRGDVRITASYAYLRSTEWDTEQGGTARRDVTLAPRHSAGVVGSIEREGVSRLALELYYVGRQALHDNPYRAVSAPYVIIGLLGERQVHTSWGRARVFVNAENVGNVRQTRYDPLVRPTRGAGGRWTTDAWTELGGATVNGGIRFIF
jgi:outer membrane receptor for ferrienterochelin and colicins